MRHRKVVKLAHSTGILIFSTYILFLAVINVKRTCLSKCCLKWNGIIETLIKNYHGKKSKGNFTIGLTYDLENSYS